MMNISGTIDGLIGDSRLHWRLDRSLRQLGRLQGLYFRNIGPTTESKAFIFCTSYINDPKRYQRWIDYVYPRRTVFGADSVFLINDGSENIGFDNRAAIISAEQSRIDNLPSDLVLAAFDQKLGRPSMFCYPGWWRSFTYSVRIARQYGFKKIIHIESDAYVISRRLADYIRQVNRGWTALWSPTYGFPETAVQIICEDAFTTLETFADRGNSFFTQSQRAAEYLLPFNKVESRFHGDRCGVLNRNVDTADYDYLAQVPLDWPLNPNF